MKSKNKNYWGGRFIENPSKEMIKINASIKFDKKLYKHDILASKAHATMLCNQNLISEIEKNKILKALDKKISTLI